MLRVRLRLYISLSWVSSVSEMYRVVEYMLAFAALASLDPWFIPCHVKHWLVIASSTENRAYVIDYCCTVRIYLSKNCVPQSRLMSVTRHPYILLSHTKYRDNPLKDLTCLGITSISIRTLWSFTPVSARKLLRFERMTSYLPDPTVRFKKP